MSSSQQHQAPLVSLLGSLLSSQAVMLSAVLVLTKRFVKSSSSSPLSSANDLLCFLSFSIVDVRSYEVSCMSLPFVFFL